MSERVDCLGGCGRKVLERYNPDRYCRKCKRRLRIAAGRLDYKRRREQRKKRRSQ